MITTDNFKLKRKKRVFLWKNIISLLFLSLLLYGTSGWAQNKCFSNSDCRMLQYCDIDTRRCVDFPEEDFCVAEEVCDERGCDCSSVMEPVSAECREDQECSDGKACLNGTCVECVKQSDCNSGQHCLDFKCVDCLSYKDCTGSQKWCDPAEYKCKDCPPDLPDWNDEEKRCVTPCPEDWDWNETTNECFCPDGKYWDSTAYQCVLCPGEVVDGQCYICDSEADEEYYESASGERMCRNVLAVKNYSGNIKGKGLLVLAQKSNIPYNYTLYIRESCAKYGVGIERTGKSLAQIHNKTCKSSFKEHTYAITAGSTLKVSLVGDNTPVVPGILNKNYPGSFNGEITLKRNPLILKRGF